MADTEATEQATPPRRSTPRKKQAVEDKTRFNKIYRTPATPPPGKLLKVENGFVLDCKAVSSISTDYSKTNPKLGAVIPPYNSQSDEHVQNYFKFIGVTRTLKKTDQDLKSKSCSSINGLVVDRFHTDGHGFKYLSKRNQFGAGHSKEDVDGHSQFMSGIKPIASYNGRFGYRRNTPWLRQYPSPFGTSSRSPTY